MSFFSNKAVRLLLSVSVSIWMAGGCLFGCATGAMGAESADETTVEAGASCHAMPSHDCCEQPKSKSKPGKQSTGNLKPLAGMASIIPASRGMMKDCPLSVNATAATSKSSTYLPESARAAETTLPAFEKQPLITDYHRVVPFLHNRGSTHLQCCVFLI